MNTLTIEQQNAIAKKLASMSLSYRLCDEENVCSITAINLALTGKLTNSIPDCMSRVIGQWIRRIQYSMPDQMRNCIRWKSLLPLAAGTGKQYEKERLAIIIDWMWGDVLPMLLPAAHRSGFGEQWSHMTTKRTPAAASDIIRLGTMAGLDANIAARWAAIALDVAIAAARNAKVIAGRNSRAQLAAIEAAEAAEAIAIWTAELRIGNHSLRNISAHQEWEAMDPCSVLERMIDLKIPQTVIE